MTLASDPPAPLSATLDVASGAWSCTFDRDLAAGALDAGNWLMNADDTVFTPSSATASGAVVSGASSPGTENPGSNVISYAPPPFDVVGVNERLAVAFSGFALATT